APKTPPAVLLFSGARIFRGGGPMAKCDGCGVEFQPSRKGHRFHSTDCRIQAQWGRKKHGPNRRALEVQITAMQAASEHAALVESCRQLADVVDAQVANSIFDDKAW